MSNTTTTSTTTSTRSNANDYREANYYNFYRILENTQPNERVARNGSGLVPRWVFKSTQAFDLHEFSIESSVTDTCVLSLWKQSYTNELDTPIEAIYRIPLSPLSCISAFSVEFNDKILIGKIKEKQSSRDIYSDTISSGGQAFIAETSDDNGYFSFIIGNLPPRTNVIINLTMISEIGTHLSSLHYCLHRYMFQQSQFKFNLNLKIELNEPIKSINFSYTGGNGIREISNDGINKSNIKFSTSTGILSNLIFVIQQEKDQIKPQSFIEYNEKDKSYGIALNFYPRFESISIDEINQKGEFIFVIDCSGSMAGNSIERAKRALEIIIRSLNEKHKLNIYCFGSSFNKAFPSSVHYNDETLNQVDKYVSNISANLGNTELLPPIKDILSNGVNDPEYPRQVFILTDGAVTKRDELINYVGNESGTTRIFTIGIGNSVDVELVVGLSKSCKGYYELIKDNSNMEVQIMKLLSIAFEPIISNIKFDWSELNKHCNVIQAPTTIRPIFNNERMIVYSLINEIKSSSSSSSSSLLELESVTITMNCNGPTGSKLSYPIVLDFKNAIKDGSNSVHTLAAFKHIQDLEEIERKESNEHQKDKIVEFGKKYNLVSNHTSFIVSSKSDDPTFDTMETVDVLRPYPSFYQRVGMNNNMPMGVDIHNNMSMGFAMCGISMRGGMNNNIPMGGVMNINMSMGGGINNNQMAINNMGNYSMNNNMNNNMKNMNRQIGGGMNIHGHSYHPYSPYSNGSGDRSNSTLEFQSSSSSTSPSRRQLFIEQSQQYPSSRTGCNLRKGKCQKRLSSAKPSAPINDPLIILLKLQKANGSFIKSTIDQFEIKEDKIPNEFKSDHEIWVTLLVIAYILKTFSSQKQQFELSIQKSIKWVKQQLTKLNLTDSDITTTSSFDRFLSLANNSI